MRIIYSNNFYFATHKRNRRDRSYWHAQITRFYKYTFPFITINNEISTINLNRIFFSNLSILALKIHIIIPDILEHLHVMRFFHGPLTVSNYT